ncbi:hypothetical protein NA57DRAFT_60512 [Rhizodiscina lignyota]|uniref:Lipocalin-like domain-containing protein n=1 Tax=Rhizodiscina lignyota TaxID=1504668 RepID=A0A9P4I857_9PEZI|nr:hypothetical protein NA57DRAFT_60512 [Rhizodiscina lignyota]
MSILSKLTGTWDCTYWTETNTNDPSDVIHTYSKDVKGVLMYTSDGYMSAMMQHPDVPSYTLGFLQGTDGEHIEAASKTHGYNGSFTVQEPAEAGKSLVIEHHVLMGLPTNLAGKTQRRFAEITEEAGQLYLTIRADFAINRDRVDRNIEVGWKKREPISPIKAS